MSVETDGDYRMSKICACQLFPVLSITEESTGLSVRPSQLQDVLDFEVWSSSSSPQASEQRYNVRTGEKIRIPSKMTHIKPEEINLTRWLLL